MFFEVLGVQYGLKIEEKSLKMAMLAPRWALLGDFWVMLSHVGGKMATKSARMSQHRRQGPNPRGFEGFTDGPDGRELAGRVGRSAFWLGGASRGILQEHFARRLEASKNEIRGSKDRNIKT